MIVRHDASVSQDFAAMVAFAAVVREGGFTAAARQVGASKQGLSDQVARLEAALGVRLLERTTRRVRPTEAGERYCARCAAIVEQAEAANRELLAGLAEPTGTLRVASTATFGELILVDAVARYVSAWPRVSVDLFLADRPVNVVEEGYDIAFWFERPADTSFIAKRIAPAATYFVAHPSFVARHGVPASPQRLGRWIEWTSRSDHGQDAPPVLRVNSPRAALAAALRGIGVARLPSLLVAEDVRAGRLVVLFDGQPARSSEIHAIYPAGRFVPPKTRRFLETVEAAAASMATPSEPRPTKRPARRSA
jgi:DNA-binding transcriptional LysR family regulator